MKFNLYLIMLLCTITIVVNAQNAPSHSLNIGDSAPPLQVRSWLKGSPIQKFEKGRVYVIEFWATWCMPCIAAMPHLSYLAREYKDKVTIIGMDVMEKEATTIERIRAFVDSMGQKIDYHVAAEDSNFMVAGWLEATGARYYGIPSTFVVNREGKLAWIGHPKDLDGVLRKIVDNTWNVREALEKRKEAERLRILDKEAHYTLQIYLTDQFRPGYPGNPDSALMAISEIVRKEPKLKYAPFIVSHTFSSLLKTDFKKAYKYGKAVLVYQPLMNWTVF